MTRSKQTKSLKTKFKLFGWAIVALPILFFVIKNFKEYRPSFLFPKWKDYQVYGIDVSRHQGDIDWYQLKNHEVQFAFIKSSEGSTLVDKRFRENWNSAREVGIARGAYHFYRPNVDWKEQAKNFIDQVHLEKGDLPPVIDIELIHSNNQKYLVSEIKKWLVVIERHYGVKPIVYTYENYYNRFLLEDFRGYNLWIAKYSNNSPSLDDDAHWEFWQYSESGKLTGVSENIDLNCFYGTRDEFQRILKK